MQVANHNKAKVAAATISKAVLEHNVACAREGVQMATRATDAKSAIAAAEHVVEAVSRIMGVASNNVGIKTLQRAAAASTTTEPRLQNSSPQSPTPPQLKHLKLLQQRKRQRPRLKLLIHRCADATATPDWSAASTRNIKLSLKCATACADRRSGLQRATARTDRRSGLQRATAPTAGYSDCSEVGHSVAQRAL